MNPLTENTIQNNPYTHLSIFQYTKKKKKDLVIHCIESSSHFGQLKKKENCNNNNNNNINNDDDINHDNINKINVYTICISLLASNNRHS